MPEATVAAIITDKENGVTKVLLTRRNVEPFSGQWCLPGGHIHRRESAEDAIIREVKEETSLDFSPHFFGYFDEIIPEPGLAEKLGTKLQYDIHAVVMVFEGQGIGVPNAQRDEVREIRWFSIDEARALPLAFTHNKILDAYAARTSFGVI